VGKAKTGVWITNRCSCPLRCGVKLRTEFPLTVSRWLRAAGQLNSMLGIPGLGDCRILRREECGGNAVRLSLRKVRPSVDSIVIANVAKDRRCVSFGRQRSSAFWCWQLPLIRRKLKVVLAAQDQEALGTRRGLRLASEERVRPVTSVSRSG
jgi:hypothetical protein